MRRGVNPNGGEMVCIVRPRFDAWAFAARLMHNEAEVSESIVRKLVDLAGASVGLYDNRPARGGTNGQFEVVQWNVEADSSMEAAPMKLDWDHLPGFATPGKNAVNDLFWRVVRCGFVLYTSAGSRGLLLLLPTFL